MTEPLSTPAAQGTVAGWKLVPVELTPKMLQDAAFNLSDEFGADFVKPLGEFAKALWSELLSASPSPEALPASGVEAMRQALKDIAEHTNPDDDDNYRADDREGCFDTVYAIAALAAAPAPEDQDLGWHPRGSGLGPSSGEAWQRPEGGLNADWVAMVLSEDARIEEGKLANPSYLAVKIADAADMPAEVVRLRKALAHIRDHTRETTTATMAIGALTSSTVEDRT